MTEMNQSQTSPAPAIPARTRRLGLGRTALVGGALVLGVALGAGGLAAAASSQMGGWHGGPRLERIQAIVLRALDSVGATSDQETKIHDIVARSFDQVAPDRESRMAMRKQALELLKAPTIDRAAVEKLRADQVAAFDARSKVLVGAVLDAADVLTPDQRVKLADRIEQWKPRGPWGGHRGSWSERRGHDMRPDSGPGPDAPDEN